MTYIQNVIVNYVTEFMTGREGLTGAPVKMVTHAKFNPNLKSSWFTSVMQIISNLTMITVILTGAALIREREQGTVEHLLVMPVVAARDHAVEDPGQWHRHSCVAAGLIAAVCRRSGGCKCRSPDRPCCFLGGACFYVFTVAALGIAPRHRRFHDGASSACCAIPVLLVMMLLSGSTTPLESMPVWLQYLMKVISPTPHFVIFAQDVLYRGADFSIVWPEILATAVIGDCLFRFRSAIVSAASFSAAELRTDPLC